MESPSERSISDAKSTSGEMEKERGGGGVKELYIPNNPSTDAPRWLPPAPKQADGTVTWSIDASWSKNEIGPVTCKGRKRRGDGGAQSRAQYP